MKKVVFVGGNDLLVDFFNATAKARSVIVYDSGIFTKQLKDTIKIVKLPKYFPFIRKNTETSIPFMMSGLVRELKKESPDTIVVMDFIRLWYLQVIWYRFWHPKAKIYVYSETQRSPTKFYRKLIFQLFLLFYKMTRPLVSGYLVYTNLGKMFAQKNNLFCNIVVVPIPVDVDKFLPSKMPIYNRTGITRILMNARFVTYKRHIDLLEALKVLKDKSEKFSATFVGRGDYNKVLIEEQIRHLGLEQEVCFHQTVTSDKIVSLYNNHDVLILPSDNEAIGMVVPEAMSCALPVIVSDTVGASVYINPGQDGYVFKTGDVNHLVECIELINDKATLLEMGLTARKNMLTNFTISKCSDHFLQSINS